MIVPYNALLYLALIRPVFCIGATVKPNWNKACKKPGPYPGPSFGTPVLRKCLYKFVYTNNALRYI